MPTPRRPAKKSTVSSPSLSDRVQERVDTAAASIAATARDRRRRKPLELGSAGDRPQEVRALFRVFREMGRSQRVARRQTNSPPSPVVRDAALAFQRTPTIAALVLVAASLDEVGLLPW